MMLKNQQRPRDLSKRERQVMDILFAAGEATAHEVQSQLERPPSYSAVRSTLRILEEKGQVQHRQDGPRYVYMPRVEPETAQRSALEHVTRTFFRGSAEQVMAALIDESASELTEEQLDRLSALIEAARQKRQDAGDDS